MQYSIGSLGLGKILDQAVALLRDNFWLLLGIALVLNVPLGVLTRGLFQLAFRDIPANTTDEPVWTAVGENAPYVGMGIAAALAYGVGLLLTNGAVIHAVAEIYLGRSAGIMTAFRRSLGLLWRLLWTGFVFVLLSTLWIGFVVLLLALLLSSLVYGLSLPWVLVAVVCFAAGSICGVYLVYRWLLYNQIVIVERIGGFRALKRSAFLMRGQYLKAIALSVLLGVVSFASSMATAMIPNAIAVLVVDQLVTGAYAVFAGAVLVVFYFSARSSAEHFDLAVLAHSIAEGTAAPGLEWERRRTV